MKKNLLLFILIQISLFAQVKNFNIYIENENVEIKWFKLNELSEFFIVQRKSAQIDTWEQIEKIPAENRTNFSYTDVKLPAEKFYYRIVSLLKEGVIKYSKILQADLNTPFRFILKQNYPNPFNPETSIKYSISTSGYVDLRIYNVLGQEIKNLISEYQEPGEYIVNFNADELNSGLYIYKLISGDQVLTRKMTLLK